MKQLLITGAAGGIGSHFRRTLAGRYRLRLCDIAPIESLDPGETFVQADLRDVEATCKATDGVDGIVHLGGVSSESDWDSIHGANIVGCYNVFEAARQTQVPRIVFASSNHAVGFYPRTQTIDHGVVVRPDSRYGLSKAFGEALGSLYADKYGLGVMCIRIGNVADEPIDRRRLAIWVSPRDLTQLVCIGLEHPDMHYEIVYGASDNARAWWDNSRAVELGYAPEDRSEDYAETILDHAPADDPNNLADRVQGGEFAIIEQGGGAPKM